MLPVAGEDKVNIILATVGSVVGFAIIVVCLYFLMTRRRKQQDDNIKDTQSLLQLDFDTIRVATNDFSTDNQLGEGGFGAVYKVI